MVSLERVSILLLTEDSGKQAHDTLFTLAKKMLLLLEPTCGTDQIDFKPPTLAQVQRAVQANLWKGDRRARVELFRYITTKLLEPGFVLFHSTAIGPGRSERPARTSPS